MTKDVRVLIAEALGSLVLLVGGGLAILAGGDTIAIAFGFGLALMAGLYAFGEISGGHFNPAVSFAAFLDKRIDATTFLKYVAAQVVGAVVGGYILLAASSEAAVARTVTANGAELSNVNLVLLEALFTAFFVMVILRVTSSDAYGSSAFGAISFTLIMAHLALVPITGASLNPARSLGSAVAGSQFDDMALYIVGPLLGAAVGWFIHDLLSADEDADVGADEE